MTTFKKATYAGLTAIMLLALLVLSGCGGSETLSGRFVNEDNSDEYMLFGTHRNEPAVAINFGVYGGNAFQYRLRRQTLSVQIMGPPRNQWQDFSINSARTRITAPLLGGGEVVFILEESED